MNISEILEDKDLEKDSYEIIKSCIDYNISLNGIAKYFVQLPVEIKSSYIDSWPFDYNLLYEIINLEHNTKILNKIFKNYVVDLKRVNLKCITDAGKRIFIGSRRARNLSKMTAPLLNIPASIFTKEVATHIFKNNNPFNIRFLINDLNYATDTTFLNEQILKLEDDVINKYPDSFLSFPFTDILNLVRKFLNVDMRKESAYLEKEKILLMLEKFENKFKLKDLNNTIRFHLLNHSFDKIVSYLKELNDNWISNYIIDFHFQDNYYNVLIDMKSLLHYVSIKEIKIPKWRLKLYSDILKIDTLSPDKKVNLHNQLKKIDIKAYFYEDIFSAKKKMRSQITKRCINRESIKQYYDKELSAKYKVPIYDVKDSKFLALVKYGFKVNSTFPTGYSYSLIKDGFLTTAASPNNANTFIYDTYNMTPDQIAHIFPYDSYTEYSPFELYDTPTDYVNVITSINEIFQSNKHYTEILILEKSGELTTDIDKDIPRLEKLAVYSVDYITNSALEEALEQNLPIFLVHNLKEEKTRYNKYVIPRNIIYFNDSLNLSEFENARRMKKFTK